MRREVVHERGSLHAADDARRVLTLSALRRLGSLGTVALGRRLFLRRRYS